MNRIYVHSQNPFPIITAHKGIWNWPLPDGTYIVAIGHDDAADARMQASQHPDILEIAPSRTTGGNISPTLLAAILGFLNQKKTLHGIKDSAAAPTALNTNDLLTQIFNITGDPAWHPDSSL